MPLVNCMQCYIMESYTSSWTLLKLHLLFTGQTPYPFMFL